MKIKIALIVTPLLAVLALIGWVFGDVVATAFNLQSNLVNGLFSYGLVIGGVVPAYIITDVIERRDKDEVYKE